jgi:hypothetical protein
VTEPLPSYTGGFSHEALQSFSELVATPPTPTGPVRRPQKRQRDLGTEGQEHLDAEGSAKEQRAALKTTKRNHPTVRALAASLREQKTVPVGAEFKEDGDQGEGNEDFAAFTDRLETLRQRRRNNLPLTGEEWAELEERETLAKDLRAGKTSFSEAFGDTFDFVRCRRDDGSHYGTRGTCRKGTTVAAETGTGRPAKRFGDKETATVANRGHKAATQARAEKVLADLKPALPSKLATLQKLASGERTLPKNPEKRRELFRAAHARLAKLGNNRSNPTLAADKHWPERDALSAVLRLLDPEQNSWNRLTRADLDRASGGSKRAAE